jgi:hypothetical protein
MFESSDELQIRLSLPTNKTYYFSIFNISLNRIIIINELIN